MLSSMRRAAHVMKGAGYAALGYVSCELVARFGTRLPDQRAVAERIHENSHGILSMYDNLVGGALARGSILGLGILPYLSARSFVGIGRYLSARLDALENSDRGRHRLLMLTRALTFVLALIQAFGYATFTQRIGGATAQGNGGYVIQTTIVMTLVASFLGWIAEQVAAPDMVDSAAPAAEILNEPAERLIPAGEFIADLRRKANEKAPLQAEITPH